MDSQLKKYILAAGVVGLSYALFNYLTEEKHKPIPLNFTKKILQQIKHQMLIATVNFSQGVKNHINAKVGSIKQAESQLIDYMLDEMEKIYKSKQQLILNKYEVSEGSYRVSLKMYEKDDFIKKNVAQIIQMMQKAVEGKTPDLTVPKQASETFTKEELHEFYLQMCIRIAKLVVKKLQELMQIDPYFDPANDLCFRRAIRQLLIYDVKVEFLKLKGFKESWGCPNQTFFKIFESQKLKSPEYKKEMLAIEKTYEKIIQVATNDVKSLSSQKIQQIFNSLKKQKSKITQSMVIPPTSEKNYFDEEDLKFRKTISKVEKLQQDEQPQQNILTSIRTSVEEQNVEELKAEEKKQPQMNEGEGEKDEEKVEEVEERQQIPVKQEKQENQGKEEKVENVEVEKEENVEQQDKVENNEEPEQNGEVKESLIEVAESSKQQDGQQNLGQKMVEKEKEEVPPTKQELVSAEETEKKQELEEEKDQ